METTGQITDQQTPPSDIAGDTATIGKQHLAKNTLSNLMFVVFNAGSSFVMTPFLIHRLGMPTYAMVYIANSFVSYLSVLTIAVIGGTSRFVGLEVSRDNREEARDYLSTQSTATLWILLLLLPVTAAVSIYAPQFLRIPHGQETNTQLLLALTFASFLISLIASPFRVTTMVSQRFDLSNLVEIANQIVRYSTWVVMFVFVAPRLWEIGLGYALGTVAVLAGFIIAFRHLTPWLWPKMGYFNRQKFIESAKMGGWMSVAQIGLVLYLGVDGIIINQKLGSASCGKYGTIALLVGQLRVMSGMLMYTLAMPLISCCAAGEWARLMLNTARAVKYLALLLALLLGVFCGLSSPFVICWLGPKYPGLPLLIWLMTAHLVINMGMDPTSGSAFAANRMSGLAIATVAAGALKLALALIFITHTRWGVYSVVVADIIAITLKSQIFAPLYMKRITGVSCLPIYKALVTPVIVFGATSGTALLVTRGIDFAALSKIAAWGLLAAIGLVLLAAFGVLAYLFALSKSDREFFRQVSPWKKKADQAGAAS